MTFHFTDADGDSLRIGIPATPAGPGPCISIYSASNEPVHIPLDRVEEVAAGIRDTARTASGQQPEQCTSTCPDGEPCPSHDERVCPAPETHNWGCGCPTDQMPGSSLAEAVAILHEAMDHGVKDPVARQRLIGQLVGACHHAAELRAAVGQPAEAHDTEVLRIRDRWYVEYFYGQGTNAWWGVAQGPHITREQALAEKETRRDEPADRRVVRETTTWTVENER